MNCSESFELISGHIDGVNTPEQEAQLQAHLQTCPDCRRLLSAWEYIELQVEDLEVPAPAGLKDSVMEQIRQKSSKRPRRFRLSPGAGIGLVAACLLLLVGVGVIRLPKMSLKSAASDAVATEASTVLQLEPEAEATEAAAADRAPVTEAATEALAAYGTDAPEATLETAVPQSPEEPAPEEADTNGTDLYGAYSAVESRRSLPSVDISPVTRKLCLQRSQDAEAAVLLYTEFGTSLLELIRTEEPELYARFENLEPELDEEGSFVYATTYQNIMALQEWLLTHLPRSEDPDPAVQEAEFSLMLRFYELDPDNGCLTRIITPRDHPTQIVWPDFWPEDWARRMRLEENWSLFFPWEDYSPMAEDLAYLVLVPTAEDTP